ncbi:hypothetical protein ARSEF1564_007544 [Beauveria bassiana]
MASHQRLFRTMRNAEESRKFLSSAGYARNFDSPLTANEKGWGSSLTEHISGRNKPVSLFVSTTYDPIISMKFASGGETPEFYIYDIAQDKKAIDVEKSIKKFEASYAATQKEVTFVKGIPNEQIKGHYVLKPGDYNPSEQLTLEGFRERFADRYVPNAKFDDRYLSTKSSGKQTQFDKLYTGPTTAQQETFAKDYAATLGKKELQSPESAAKDLQSFFEKASPKEKLLDSSRPNWSRPNTVKPEGGIGGESKPGELPPEEGPKPGTPDAEVKPQPGTPEVEVKPETKPQPGSPEVEVKPETKPQPGSPEVEVKPEPKPKPGTPEVEVKPQPKPKPVDLVPAQRAQLVAVAERISEKEFTNMAGKTGLKAIIERRWNKGLSEVRTKVLGYKKLSIQSVKLNPKGVALKVGTGGLAAVGVGLWIHGMVDAFTTESTDWDKTAAVTAIIPFVGCGTNLLAQAEKANANGVLIGVDTTLCLLGDALLLGGWTAPIGILVHLSRFLIQFFAPPPSLPSYEEIREMRDKPWQSFLDQHLTNSLASKSWRDKLEGAVSIEALGIWSQAADRIGLIEAGNQTVFNASMSADQPDIKELSLVQDDSQTSIEQIREQAEAEIVRRQRLYLLGLPKTLREDFANSMKAIADQYNQDFISKITAQDMIERYPGYVKAIAWAIPDSTLYSDSRERMNDAGSRLKKELPKLPSLFELSYFVGVAAGVDDPPPPRINPNGGPGFAKFVPAEPEDWTCAVNATVIDPVVYYREKAGEEDRRALVQHTVAVVRHLLGKIPESDLPRDAPGLSDVGEFQMLLAMHVGNTFADWKEIRGNRVGYIPEDYEKDMAELMERLYDIPRSEAAQLMG